MDRETLETLCRTFAARHSAGPVGGGRSGPDPVPEILRSFRLAEISAAEMQSLLGLVTDDDEEEVDPEAPLPALEGGLDAPAALVDDFPDFDEIVAAGFVEDDDSPLPDVDEVIAIRLFPGIPGAEVRDRRHGDR